jgi:hypothetical protein
MKQKFEILEQGDKLVIKEYAELDKETMSLLCEESYDRAAMEEALSHGTDAVVAAIRTKNMYPPAAYAEKIAQAVEALYTIHSDEPIEVLINDLDLLAQDSAPEDVAEDFEEEEADIDDLLNDDEDTDENSLEDEIAVKKIKSPLKVADDEVADMDDDL